MKDQDEEQYDTPEDEEEEDERDKFATIDEDAIRKASTAKLIDLAGIADDDEFPEDFEFEDELAEEEAEGEAGDSEYEELEPRVAILSELLDASGIEILAGDGARRAGTARPPRIFQRARARADGTPCAAPQARTSRTSR